MMQPPPTYGIDAPGVIRGFCFAGLPLLLIGAWLTTSDRWGMIGTLAGVLLTLAGVVMLVLALSMLAYGFFGKFRMRDYILSQLQLRGNERLLDIGTGRGLLAIGAAKQLTDGKAIGIDIWNHTDLSGNSIANAQRNADIENVADRVVFEEADACAIPFADGSFDAIVSLLCLHNIKLPEQRVHACKEIARVLRPGGTALIADYVATKDYADALAAAGLVIKENRSCLTIAFGLMWMVFATKPADAV